jgi:hypothetical protein
MDKTKKFNRFHFVAVLTSALVAADLAAQPSTLPNEDCTQPGRSLPHAGDIGRLPVVIPVAFMSCESDGRTLLHDPFGKSRGNRVTLLCRLAIRSLFSAPQL